MLDTQRIKSRLREIRRRVFELQSNFQQMPEKEFIANETVYNAAEHHLQIAIQACIDIASHIVAVLGLPAPSKETAEVFFSLAKERITPEDFAKVMKNVTSFRNIIVHGYLDVNRHQTYLNIQNHLPDLAKFAKYIEEFLEKQKKKS